MTTVEEKRLEPLDVERCQAEIRAAHGPFRFGPKPGWVRCENKPTKIVVELIPGPDGLHGYMSLCDNCYEVMKQQQFDETVLVIDIADRKDQK